MLKFLLILFLTGHVLGDFYLQSNYLAKSKNESYSKLVEHGLLYFLSMGIVFIPIFGLTFLKWTVLMSLIHFLIDAGMFYLNKEKDRVKKHQIQLYVMDQFIHLATIFTITAFLSTRLETIQYTQLFNRLFKEFLFQYGEHFFLDSSHSHYNEASEYYH